VVLSYATTATQEPKGEEVKNPSKEPVAIHPVETNFSVLCSLICL